MKLKILQAGDPVLRHQARALSTEEIQSASLQQLIMLMQETMREAPGVGLAAPQIGESIQLAVIEDRVEYLSKVPAEILEKRERVPVPFHVIINPQIIAASHDHTVEFYEGCLSVAGFMGLVPRALTVTVKCLNEKAQPIMLQASGWYARILQHEIDHLQGCLCIDKMKMQSFTTAENYSRYLMSGN